MIFPAWPSKQADINSVAHASLEPDKSMRKSSLQQLIFPKRVLGNNVLYYNPHRNLSSLPYPFILRVLDVVAKTVRSRILAEQH